MNSMIERLLIFFGIALLATLIYVASQGCAAAPFAPAAHTLTSTPTALLGVAKSLDVIMVLSVLALGVGVGLFFLLPTAHNLSVSMAVMAGSIEAIASFTRVTLWLVPWVAGGLALLALGVFAYEVYTNRAKIEAKI